MKQTILGAACTAILFAASGAAQAVTIGVYGSTDGISQSGNVAADLMALGMFDQVDAISNATGNLSGYDAILFYTNGRSDLTAVGNNLADYVDMGGGLVTATFLWQASNLGRLGSDGYTPFVNYNGNYSNAVLGTYDASHPIMSGVSSISGYYRDLVSLSADAQLVASWHDGNPLVAIDGSGVVGITLFPNDYYGKISGDYMQLFGNALSYAAGVPAVPVPAAAWLFGSGLLGLVGIARRKIVQ